jgi:predicted DNA-binding transcriptional regulator AlpA
VAPAPWGGAMSEPEDLQSDRPPRVAKAFDVSVMTTYRWQKSGYLPQPTRVGPRPQRWRRGVIEAIL